MTTLEWLRSVRECLVVGGRIPARYDTHQANKPAKLVYDNKTTFDNTDEIIDYLLSMMDEEDSE